MRQDALRLALREARPEWSERDLKAAQSKLTLVGIFSVEELADAFSSGDLNYRIKEAGQRVFSTETLQALQRSISAVLPSQPQTADATVPTTVAPAPTPALAPAQASRSPQLPPEEKGQRVFPEYRVLGRQGHEFKEKDRQPDKHKLVVEEVHSEQALGGPTEFEVILDLLESGEHENLFRWCKAQNFKLKRLTFRDNGLQVLERVERFLVMTATQLQTECEQRGFASYDCMPREELIELVTDAWILENLEIALLQRVCTSRGLSVDRDQTHAELLQLRADSSWEAKGIPVTRFANRVVAKKVLDLVIGLPNTSDELAAQCKSWGLPSEAKPEFMREYLHHVLIWGQLPIDELRRECQARGLSAEAGSEEDVVRKKLFQRLIDYTHLSRRFQMQERGIPVGRLRSQLEAEKILISLNRLQNLGPLALKVEYRKMEIPYSSKLDQQMLVNQLRDVLVWQRMPLGELQEECRRRGVMPRNDTRALIAKLVEVQSRMLEQEAQGLPVMLLDDPQKCFQLIEQYRNIDRMRPQDLTEWYKTTGCPVEVGMSKSEIAKFYKLILTWQVLPMDGLFRLCKKFKLPTPASMDAEQRESVVDQLFKHELMCRWETKGFQSWWIGDVGRVIGAVETYESWLAMSDEELKNTYTQVGLPDEANLAREELLKRLKLRLVWEMVPLPDLRKDCLNRGLPAQTSNSVASNDDERRSELIMYLIVDTFRSAYEVKGVSVARLGPVKAANITAQFEKYDTMDQEELRKTYDAELASNLPLPSDAPRDAMLRGLHNWVIWCELSTAELLAECRVQNIPTHGFRLPVGGSNAGQKVDQGVTDMADPEKKLRHQLLTRLLLKARMGIEEEFPPQAPIKHLPPKSASSPNGKANNEDISVIEINGTPCFDDAEKLIPPWDLPEVWKCIAQMRDTFMAEMVCGCSRRQLPQDTYLPVVARSWRPCEAALHVLSHGTFDPRKLDIPPPDFCKGDEDKLISVVCPTCDVRQKFHPLLYECFLKQEYSPKELVVVDTGKQPSPFFCEKALEDPRIIYKFYDVETWFSNSSAETKKHAWSLGLKRNIACCLARGVAIAQFDDDDLYSHEYLSYMWPKLLEQMTTDPSGIPKSVNVPAAVKLSAWHLLDISSLSFHYLDITMEKSLPLSEQRGWLYGWGFSYFFTRAAWELAPFPDVEFAEDAGFVEGLMARAVPVGLVGLSDPVREKGLVAHTLHAGSTTGNEFEGFTWKGVSIGKSVKMPSKFSSLILKLRHARPGFSSAAPRAGTNPAGVKPMQSAFANKPMFGIQPVFGKQPPRRQFGTS